jgi:diadenosine tetraphosphate (Ap4A) HIT family hydrolase
MTMDKCLFCEVSKSKYDKQMVIYEDRYFFAIFDPHPVSPGHALIIPKKHTVSLLELAPKEWIDLHAVIKKVITQIEKTNFVALYNKLIKLPPTKKTSEFCKEILKSPNIQKKPDAYNIGNNDGKAAGRTINHLHIQIIPRYFGDVKDMVGGIRNIIPKKGNYLK